MSSFKERHTQYHPFVTAYDADPNCADCSQPKTAQVHWQGDGPMPNDDPGEIDPTLAGSGGRRSGAGIYERFAWEE